MSEKKGEETSSSLSTLREKVDKGGWWMPWLTQATKDVISCDKHGLGANIR